MKKSCHQLFFLPALVVLSFSVFAQPVKKITTVFTSHIPYAGSTSYTDIGIMNMSGTYDYRFGSASGMWPTQMQRVNTFIIEGGQCISRSPIAHSVKIRRVNNALVTGNTSVLWMEGDSVVGPGKKINMRPIYEESMEVAFSAGFYNWGTDNMFDNAVAGTNNNNIERFDVIIPSGYTIINKDQEGFALYERGKNGTHDPLKVAGISGLDGTGDPDAYKALPLSVATADWGDIPGSAINHVVLRKEPGVHANLVATGIKTQDRGGIFIPFASLGFANGDKVYGYSLMAPDVNPATTAQLVNYTNNAVFPITTGEPAGGIDLIGDVDVFLYNDFCILPAIFSFIKANQVSSGVQVTWQTLTEKNNSGFEIEHSVNGTDYFRIGMVNAAENFSNKADYSFLHNMAANGTNYYRIKQVDNDGKFIYTKVVTVLVEANDKEAMAVYPNPANVERTRSIQLKLPLPGTYRVQLIDSYARVVAVANITTQNGIARFSQNKMLPKGYYVVQAININTGKKQSQALFVN